MTQYYSRKDTAFNGDVYDIPFSYIKESEIRVYIDDVLYTDWTFLNESQIKLTVMPSQAEIVSVRRETDISKKMVEFTNNTMMNKTALNMSQDQLFQSVQELYDGNTTFEMDIEALLDAKNREVVEAFNDYKEVVDGEIDEQNQTIAINKADTDNQIATNNATVEAALAVQTQTIADNKAELEQAQAEYEAEINADIASVLEAAERIDEMDEAVQTAVTASETAVQAATTATNQANIATQKALEVSNALSTKADKSTTYTKTETNNLLNAKADKTTTYTKTEVNTSLANKANVSMNNLDIDGYEKLEAQKAYKTGNVLTDEKGYQEVVEASQSTFDISKFEVVGNPVIRDDGWATMSPTGALTQRTNRLLIDGVMSQLYNKSWSFEQIVDLSDGWGSNQFNLVSFGLSKSAGISTKANYNTLNVGLSTGEGDSTQADVFIFLNNVPNEKIKLVYSFDINTGEYEAVAYRLNGSFISSATFTPSTTNKQLTNILYQHSSPSDTNKYIYIGSSWGGYDSEIPIDLKSIKIIADGQTIFNGAETGLDIIKADNYNIVGSPTISADGVVGSDTNSSNKVELPMPALGDNWEIDLPVKYVEQLNPNGLTYQYVYFEPTTNYVQLALSQVWTSGMLLYLKDTEGNNIISDSTGVLQYAFELGKQYIVKLSCEKSSSNYTYNVSLFDTQGNKLSSLSPVLSTKRAFIADNAIALNAYNWNETYPCIYDLNLFKSYSNGALVYQPCLKIPYTLSGKDTMIVDVQYRDRVIDVANQFGNALYYTLDETNQNYTIPMGNAYGMITTATKPERSIGEILTSIIPLNDEGLHLADGSLLQQNGVYGNFVAYMGGLVSSNPELFVTETDYQASITAYGVCGKFVYDSAAKTLRLPKLTGFIEGTNTPTELGNLTEAGLPNITGDVRFSKLGSSETFYDTNGVFENAGIGGGNHYQLKREDSQYSGQLLTFDASNSSAIYGNSTTVQPQSIKVFYYIVVANAKQNTALYVTPQNIISDLNGKADVDLSNLNNTGTAQIAYLSSPGNTYTDLVPVKNNPYYAPESGDYCLVVVTSANGGVFLKNITSELDVGYGLYSANASVSLMMRVKKGDEVICDWTSISSGNLRFVPAQGASN